MVHFIATDVVTRAPGLRGRPEHVTVALPSNRQSRCLNWYFRARLRRVVQHLR
jgi:hypothetical protein